MANKMKIYFIYNKTLDKLLSSGVKMYAGYKSKKVAESVLSFQLSIHKYLNKEDYKIIEVDVR